VLLSHNVKLLPYLLTADVVLHLQAFGLCVHLLDPRLQSLHLVL
jgi:hypothetical protein